MFSHSIEGGKGYLNSNYSANYCGDNIKHSLSVTILGMLMRMDVCSTLSQIVLSDFFKTWYAFVCFLLRQYNNNNKKISVLILKGIPALSTVSSQCPLKWNYRQTAKYVVYCMFTIWLSKGFVTFAGFLLLHTVPFYQLRRAPCCFLVQYYCFLAPFLLTYLLDKKDNTNL